MKSLRQKKCVQSLVNLISIAFIERKFRLRLFHFKMVSNFNIISKLAEKMNKKNPSKMQALICLLLFTVSCRDQIESRSLNLWEVDFILDCRYPEWPHNHHHQVTYLCSLSSSFFLSLSLLPFVTLHLPPI